jgi:hypothetical protein
MPAHTGAPGLPPVRQDNVTRLSRTGWLTPA